MEHHHSSNSVIAVIRAFTIIVLVTCLLVNCTSKKTRNRTTTNHSTDSRLGASSEAKKIAAYLETPEFIRHYLDSIAGKKHWIADTGEIWNGGCTKMEGYPDYQFVSANLYSDRCTMIVRTGGIAAFSHYVTVVFKNNLVKSYRMQDLTLGD